jgi:hypothetical protein
MRRALLLIVVLALPGCAVVEARRERLQEGNKPG